MADPPPIERAFLRETEQGTVFFPWGTAHRGYRLHDDGARARAARAGSLLIGSVVAIGTWAASVLQPLLESDAAEAGEIFAALAAPGAALVLVLVAYWLWAARFVERLSESDVRISREQALRETAEHAKPKQLTLAGAAIVTLGALSIWLEPRIWWLGALAVALGLGVLWRSFLLARVSPASTSRPDAIL